MRHPLHAICPYFAMFPEGFVEEHVARFTKPGEGLVFDPFAGRGTTLFQSLLMGRRAAAVDVNPVAYCVTGAKARVPRLSQVLDRVNELDVCYHAQTNGALEAERQALPPFFRVCFSPSTLRELLFLREYLDWRGDALDRFIAALSLGCLHGETGKPMQYFSNQMPRTISTKPEYSLRYWRRNGLRPPRRDAFRILRERAAYRLQGPRPARAGIVRLGDARGAARLLPRLRRAVDLVVTSPPYFDVTNFEEDQWLRLWFLGYEPRPTYGRISGDDRYDQKEPYWRFLREAWAGIAPLVKPSAVLVCRMGGRGMGPEELTEGLLASLLPAFPRARMRPGPARSAVRNRQTTSFRPGAEGCRYEWDYVLTLGSPGS